jgi:chloramphenicol-sensitive protein RarD
MPRCAARWAAICTRSPCRPPLRRTRKIRDYTVDRLGFLAATSAYLIWGLFPLYYHQLAMVSALEVLCHRIVWSLAFSLVLLATTGKLSELVRTLTTARTFFGLLASGLCVSINWGAYIWAVAHNQALDASLAYFALPLVTLGLGVVLLREHLSIRQSIAVVIVIVAVAILGIHRGSLPWIVVVLPLSFGLYGFLRKLVAVDAMVGVTVETLLVAPFAAIYLLTRPEGGALLTASFTIRSLLLLCGPVTTIPLVLFGFGARHLRLSTLGLLQYVNPTLQMLVAVALLGEPLEMVRIVIFALIWVGLVIYSVPLKRS